MSRLNEGAADVDANYELVEDLEIEASRSTSNQVRTARALRIECPVTVQPADLVDRDSWLASGTTLDVRSDHVGCVVDRPVFVGSLFHVVFHGALAEVDPVFVVCESCHMRGTTRFELGLRPLRTLELVEGHGREDGR